MSQRVRELQKPCTQCGGRCKTYDSRPSALPGVLVARRIQCTDCNHRFVTHEVIVAEQGGLSVATPHDIVLEFIKEMSDLARAKFSRTDGTLAPSARPDRIGRRAKKSVVSQ